MNDKFLFYPRPIQAVSPQGAVARPGARQEGALVFDQVLGRQLKAPPLQFSHHAQMRMSDRGIKLSAEDMARVENAVEKAGAKGGKDSLVLLDGTALIVSLKNNTVVTVVDKGSLKENVFTQIDSAVIA